MERPPDYSRGEGLCASELDAYNALCAYTLALGDPEFLHQHVVDAWAIQHASALTKTISLNFAMFGLYCCVEKSISGRQIQRFHMQMARRRRVWPGLPLPQGVPALTVLDVMRSPPAAERNGMIRSWAAAVWACCGEARWQVVELARIDCGIVP